MSINALANAAAARRSDISPVDTVPKGLAEIARAAATPPTAEGIPSPSAGPGETAAQIDTAFNVLFGYIPTEILTLYVASSVSVLSKSVNPALDLTQKLLDNLFHLREFLGELGAVHYRVTRKHRSFGFQISGSDWAARAGASLPT